MVSFQFGASVRTDSFILGFASADSAIVDDAEVDFMALMVINACNPEPLCITRICSIVFHKSFIAVGGDARRYLT